MARFVLEFDSEFGEESSESVANCPLRRRKAENDRCRSIARFLAVAARVEKKGRMTLSANKRKKTHFLSFVSPRSLLVSRLLLYAPSLPATTPACDCAGIPFIRSRRLRTLARLLRATLHDCSYRASRDDLDEAKRDAATSSPRLAGQTARLLKFFDATNRAERTISLLPLADGMMDVEDSRGSRATRKQQLPAAERIDDSNSLSISQLRVSRHLARRCRIIPENVGAWSPVPARTERGTRQS